MSLFLKQFSTHSEYDAYINGSGAILPNVSICTTEGDVHYNPYVDPCKQYDYVEICGVKWATKNVGACGITDTGLYFQWGDISGYTAAQCGVDKQFNWEDYKYCSGAGTSSSAITKYNSTDGKTVLDLEDDAARANWGGQWRMPTEGEFNALISATNITREDNYQGSGVNVRLFTDKEDSSKILVLPIVGSWYNGTFYDGFDYWSKTYDKYDVMNANNLGFGIRVSVNSSARYFGFPVRAVVDE